jgi:hypothetical protein
MINFRVRDLVAMVTQLRAAGVEVTVDPETYPNGRFARVHDPEGNPVELWEPQGRDAQVSEDLVGVSERFHDLIQTGVEFLLVDLDVAITFMDVAETFRIEEIKHRNHNNARKACDTVLHLLEQVTPDAGQDFDRAGRDEVGRGNGIATAQHCSVSCKLNPILNPDSLHEHQVGSSFACVRAILRGVSELVNFARKYPPTSGHHP